MTLSNATKEFLVANPHVRGISYNSKEIEPNFIFAAVIGFTVDGHNYIDNAIENGAIAVLSEKEPTRDDIPWIIVDNIREEMTLLSSYLNKVVPNEYQWVGVTGTNGKTTIANLLHSIFIQQYKEENCWIFGTIGNKLGKKSVEAQRTTPEAVDMYKLLGDSEVKPKVITMEVSSHALELHRVEGINYDIAIFTNLTHDHLDFHGDIESYYQAKKKLFTQHIKERGFAIINTDDIYGERLSQELNSSNVVTCGHKKDADFRVVGSHTQWGKSSFKIVYTSEKMNFETSLVGKFNISNLLLVIASAVKMGIDIDDLKRYVKELKSVPGRMEVVDIDAPFSVIVDYAHTPDAIKNILTTARSLTSKRVLVLFGAGGDRDKSKRAVMGSVVSRNCDYAVVTSDNPRSEDPETILSEICEGIPTDFPYEVEVDRREAITKILRFAQEGDAVIIAGKGHETYQEIDGVREHFDDREEIVKSWEEING